MENIGDGKKKPNIPTANTDDSHFYRRGRVSGPSPELRNGGRPFIEMKSQERAFNRPESNFDILRDNEKNIKFQNDFLKGFQIWNNLRVVARLKDQIKQTSINQEDSDNYITEDRVLHGRAVAKGKLELPLAFDPRSKVVLPVTVTSFILPDECKADAPDLSQKPVKKSFLSKFYKKNSVCADECSMFKIVKIQTDNEQQKEQVLEKHSQQGVETTKTAYVSIKLPSFSKNSLTSRRKFLCKPIVHRQEKIFEPDKSLIVEWNGAPTTSIDRYPKMAFGQLSSFLNIPTRTSQSDNNSQKLKSFSCEPGKTNHRLVNQNLIESNKKCGGFVDQTLLFGTIQNSRRTAFSPIAAPSRFVKPALLQKTLLFESCVVNTLKNPVNDRIRTSERADRSKMTRKVNQEPKSTACSNNLSFFQILKRPQPKKLASSGFTKLEKSHCFWPERPIRFQGVFN
jgi:hypothetical protein